MSTVQKFDFSVNILRALLWRHNEAVNLQQLLQFKQDYFDTDTVAFWESWTVDIFNLKTANEFGLNVWAIILGLNLTIDPTPSIPNGNFGFGPDRKNFNHGNFTPASGFSLTLEEARTVLRLRYHQLTTRATVTDINFILDDVFGDQGLAWVVDNLDMTIEYVFNFDLPVSVVLVLELYDVLPRPAGVGLTITVSP